MLTTGDYSMCGLKNTGAVEWKSQTDRLRNWQLVHTPWNA